jgi:hypothetical protein
MKIKVSTKTMMIGPVTTGCVFGGKIYSAPGPFELASCVAYNWKTFVDQFGFVSKTIWYIAKLIDTFQLN